MTEHAVAQLDDPLKRDIAVLTALAQLHCATVHQLHALCFPYHTVATARLTLYYLAEAHFISRSNWRLRRESQERGQVWTLTAKGHDLLQRYVPRISPLAHIDLARPSSAIEHEEWRVRIQIRTFLVRLLLEARRTAVLNCIQVQLPWDVSWPTPCGDAPQPEPDALLAVVWYPAKRQSATWLPWLEPDTEPSNAIQYPIYLERTYARTSLADLLPLWAVNWPVPGSIPVAIFQNDDLYVAASQHIATLSHVRPLRLATLRSLETALGLEQWRNEHGTACGLRPMTESTVA